jgi:hypothetical protein
MIVKKGLIKESEFVQLQRDNPTLLCDLLVIRAGYEVARLT